MLQNAPGSEQAGINEHNIVLYVSSSDSPTLKLLDKNLEIRPFSVLSNFSSYKIEMIIADLGSIKMFSCAQLQKINSVGGGSFCAVSSIADPKIINPCLLLPFSNGNNIRPLRFYRERFPLLRTTKTFFLAERRKKEEELDKALEDRSLEKNRKELGLGAGMLRFIYENPDNFDSRAEKISSFFRQVFLMFETQESNTFFVIWPFERNIETALGFFSGQEIMPKTKDSNMVLCFPLYSSLGSA